MKGSEKQIAWAEKIKAAKMEEIQKFLNDNAAKMNGQEKIIYGFVEKLQQVEKASFWIDQRDSGALHLLKLAATGKLN